MTIALLATGDEIVHGDTLNTNSHHIAQALSAAGLPMGIHMACSDKERDMIDCLNFLKKEHNIIIITGGLGPTSDDRTRFALAKMMNAPLIEYPEAMNHIQQKLKAIKAGLNEGNRKQALFPDKATLLPNPRGSAMGCYGSWNDRLFILLPGPPRECWPMFNDFILPLLEQEEHSEKQILKWLVFGLAESELGEQLDRALEGIDCQTGFRLDVPYIEFKVRCRAEFVERVKQCIEPLIRDHLISSPGKKASQDLCEKITKLQCELVIIDDVTGGQLQTLIQKPDNYSKLKFHESDKPSIRFHLRGLEEYWQHKPFQGKTRLSIQYQNKNQGTETHQIPYRSPLVIHHAAEWLCYRISHLIDELHQ